MKLWVENCEQPNIKVLLDTDQHPIGYVEIVDDIEMWATEGEKAIESEVSVLKDKKALRAILKDLIYTKMGVTEPAHIEDQAKWDLLSTGEKAVAVDYFIVVKESFQLEVKNDDRYWTLRSSEYREWTNNDRAKRLATIEALIFRRIVSIDDAKKVIEDFNQIIEGTVIDLDVDDTTKEPVKVRYMSQQYVNGIEGTETDGAGFVGLRDYIDSANPFVNKGFRDLTCTFRSGHTAASVADELLTVMDGTW